MSAFPCCLGTDHEHPCIQASENNIQCEIKCCTSSKAVKDNVDGEPNLKCCLPFMSSRTKVLELQNDKAVSSEDNPTL
jgi:hypothetical protein